MFDIGFWEIVVVTIIALLIVGPEKLPLLARQIGRLVGKTRRFLNNIQREFKREFLTDEAGSFDDKLEELGDLMKHAPDRDPDFTPRQTASDADRKPG